MRLMVKFRFGNVPVLNNRPQKVIKTNMITLVMVTLTPHMNPALGRGAGGGRIL